MRTVAWLNKKYQTLHHANGVDTCDDVTELMALCDQQAAEAVIYARGATLKEALTEIEALKAKAQEAQIEARAAELHEGCRMPMEQARELATSEAGPDWYARGQDWGLADALTNAQNGDWTLDDIARAFAAGAQVGAVVERESVDDALMIVKSYGPWGADLNDAHRRQIVLADEVLRLRKLYEMAVSGRSQMRTALRIAREGYASEAATGLPVLPQWRERTVALIDEASRA